MVDQAASDWWKENESPLDQEVEGDLGEFYLPAGCGDEQYMNQCIHCGCPMGKHPGEDLMALPKTSVCADCATRDSGL